MENTHQEPGSTGHVLHYYNNNYKLNTCTCKSKGHCYTKGSQAHLTQRLEYRKIAFKKSNFVTPLDYTLHTFQTTPHSALYVEIYNTELK